MYLAPKSSPSMTKRNQKNSDEYIRGPWFEKGEKQLTKRMKNEL